MLSTTLEVILPCLPRQSLLCLIDVKSNNKKQSVRLFPIISFLSSSSLDYWEFRSIPCPPQSSTPSINSPRPLKNTHSYFYIGLSCTKSSPDPLPLQCSDPGWTQACCQWEYVNSCYPAWVLGRSETPCESAQVSIMTAELIFCYYNDMLLRTSQLLRYTFLSTFLLSNIKPAFTFIKRKTLTPWFSIILHV